MGRSVTLLRLWGAYRLDSPHRPYDGYVVSNHDNATCPFNAIIGNGEYCPIHSHQWYPLKHERGGRLLGTEFLRGGKNSKKFRGCDCNQPSCLAAGYFPSQDALRINT